MQFQISLQKVTFDPIIREKCNKNIKLHSCLKKVNRIGNNIVREWLESQMKFKFKFNRKYLFKAGGILKRLLGCERATQDDVIPF